LVEGTLDGGTKLRQQCADIGPCAHGIKWFVGVWEVGWGPSSLR
jgi:hypothetical protein